MATITSLVDLALREQHTDIEDTVTITRENGETACFAVQHFGQVELLHLVTFDQDMNPTSEIELPLAEARLLRMLLNDSRVVALLESAE